METSLRELSTTLSYGASSLPTVHSGLVIVALLTLGCSIEESEPPPLSGPSELSASLSLNAIPERLVANGETSSLLVAILNDSDGQALAAEPVRFQVETDEAVPFESNNSNDTGALTAEGLIRPAFNQPGKLEVTVRTAADGVALARYWSPCRADLGNGRVTTIVAWPRTPDFRGVTPRQIDILLRSTSEPEDCEIE